MVFPPSPETASPMAANTTAADVIVLICEVITRTETALASSHKEKKEYYRIISYWDRSAKCEFEVVAFVAC